MKHAITPANAAIFIVGALAIASIHAVDGWWLNSGRGVLHTVLLLSILGFLIALARPGSLWPSAAALWAGAMVGSTAILFWTGPGNIFPIVLTFAAGISAAAAFGGAGVGFLANAGRSRFAGPPR